MKLDLAFSSCYSLFTLAITLRGGRVAYMSGGSFKEGEALLQTAKLLLVLDAPRLVQAQLFNQLTLTGYTLASIALTMYTHCF